jgi:hydrogenase nickel incorporation protein HypB
MCGTCGCSETGRFVRAKRRPSARVVLAANTADEQAARRDRLERAVLDKNAHLAAENRAAFEASSLLVLNFMSSPGSGKTTLLERTIAALALRDPQLEVLVIQGDQATDRDAERVRAAGARAVQINTGQGCHLDAAMVERAARELAPSAGALLAIENVGNLVCPAMFDLGEARRIAVISVTEGDDKPLKYPHMFRSSDLVLINKLDLLEHCDFDLDACRRNVLAMNPRAEILVLSARRGDGMEAWLRWLQHKLARALPLALGSRP